MKHMATITLSDDGTDEVRVKCEFGEDGANNDSAAHRTAVVMMRNVAVTDDEPIDMVLHCPKCHEQHIDAPEIRDRSGDPHDIDGGVDWRPDWLNPPHKSHLCHACGCIWRPADVPTNGVMAVETRGKDDNYPVEVAHG